MRSIAPVQWDSNIDLEGLCSNAWLETEPQKLEAETTSLISPHTVLTSETSHNAEGNLVMRDHIADGSTHVTHFDEDGREDRSYRTQGGHAAIEDSDEAHIPDLEPKYLM